VVLAFLALVVAAAGLAAVRREVNRATRQLRVATKRR
jgi:hypothetical protein